MFKYLVLAFMFINFNAFAVDYKYDNAKRITEATYKDGTVVSYTYDKNGNLLSITPNESSSGGDDSGGSDSSGGDSGGTDTTPDTPAPTNNESSGGTFGWLTLLLTSGLVALRSRAKVKLNR